MKIIYCFVILALLSTFCKADEKVDTSAAVNAEYDIMPDDAYDHSDYYYKLHFLKEERININTCTLKKLLSIPIISYGTASAIILYRGKNEKIFSLSELFMIHNIDSVEISSLMPYLRTGFELGARISETRSKLSPYRVSLLARAINSSQMVETYGKGIKALKAYSSIRLSYGDSIHLGVCTEKDVGEKNLADYRSFYFRYNNLLGIDYLLVGDYVTEFGKGLIVWAPFRQMRNSNSGNPLLGFGQGVREHSGTSESLFMRGAALGVHFDYLQLEYFFSHRSIDASFDSSGSFISYISLSGYHRSPLEITRQSSATENLAGSIMTLSNYRTYEMKLLLLYDTYSAPLAQKLNIRQKALSGSLSYAYCRKSFLINGEIGQNNNKTGLISNIKLTPVESTSMIMSYRRYSPSFLGIHSSAFSVNTESATGEEGFYSGIHIVYRKIGIDSYADFFRTIGADKFGLCYNGTEYFVSFSYSSSTALEHKLGLKYTVHESPDKGFLYVDKKSYSQLLTWYDLDYKLGRQFTLKSRIGITRLIDTTHRQGFLSYIQMNYHLNQTITFSGRAYFYNSDDFSSGFYAAEGEVPGYVITSHLYHDGSRYFIALSTVLLNHLHLSFKAAAQRYESFNDNKYFSQYSLQCELRY